MARYKSATYVLVGTLVVMLVPCLDALRRQEFDSEGVRSCMHFQMCECGKTGLLNHFKQCFEMLENRTQYWLIELSNDQELCPGTSGLFTVDEIIDTMNDYCTFDASVRDNCMGNVIDLLKQRYVTLTASIDFDDHEETDGLRKAFDCLTPAYQRCNEYPDECME